MLLPDSFVCAYRQPRKGIRAAVRWWAIWHIFFAAAIDGGLRTLDYTDTHSMKEAAKH